MSKGTTSGPRGYEQRVMHTTGNRRGLPDDSQKVLQGYQG